MRRLIDPETGEIIDAIVITDLERFTKAQKRLTLQGRPARRSNRTQYGSTSTARWWMRIINHLAPIVIFSAIAVSLMLHK